MARGLNDTIRFIHKEIMNVIHNALFELDISQCSQETLIVDFSTQEEIFKPFVVICEIGLR
jgi:hypothetical protein